MYGILFDLDGPLLDTLEDLADSVNYALEQHGHPQRTLEEIRTFVGNGAAMLIKLATSESEDYEQVLRTFQSYYKTHCQVKMSPRSVMEKTLNSCRRYARNFNMDAGNLLLSGSTGLGKTHLALAIGAAVGEQGYSVCYETAAGLFSKLEKAKFAPSEETIREAEKLEKCDLLIVDDLGTEMPSQFVTAALYNLLNTRLLAKKPMIITTNLNVDEAASRYSMQIASRLYGEFKRLTFLGSDIRILKSRG